MSDRLKFSDVFVLSKVDAFNDKFRLLLLFLLSLISLILLTLSATPPVSVEFFAGDAVLMSKSSVFGFGGSDMFRIFNSCLRSKTIMQNGNLRFVCNN